MRTQIVVSFNERLALSKLDLALSVVGKSTKDVDKHTQVSAQAGGESW